jgi:hypothetical protein
VATPNDSSTFSTGRSRRRLACHLNGRDVAETVNSAFEVDRQQTLQSCR